MKTICDHFKTKLKYLGRIEAIRLYNCLECNNTISDLSVKWIYKIKGKYEEGEKHD